MKKSAFIIGGGGFLGFHLAEDLHERGYLVTLFDMRKPSHFDADSRFKFITGDLSDNQVLSGHLVGHDVVFHVASPPYFLDNKKLFYRVNVEGTFGIIEACQNAGVSKLVLTSSCSVVFNGRDIKNANETVDFPSSYLDYYTETKMMQERIVLSASSPSFFTAAIRPHGIFGPRDGTVSEMIKKADEGKMKFIIGDGSNIVDFTYVRNVTHGHILAAEALGPQGKANGQSFIITNDEPVHFWIFTGKILEKVGYKSPSIHLPYYPILLIAYILHFVYVCFKPFMKQPFLTPFKVSLAGTHHYYDCSKAKKVLGYVPLYSLSTAMDETAKYYKDECLNKKSKID